MKHILLLTTIIGLSACVQHQPTNHVSCPRLVAGELIEVDCNDGNGIPSGVLDGGSKPVDPKDDHPTKPDVKPEPPKDKPKKDKDHGHDKGHHNGGFGEWKGKGWEDHKDW